MQTEQLRADADWIETLAGTYDKAERLYSIARRLRDAASALDAAPTFMEWNGSCWAVAGEQP